MKKYAIKILTSNNESSYYYKGDGDPSRTGKLEFAQLFRYSQAANRALSKLRKEYPNRRFLVIAVKVSVTELEEVEHE